MSVAQFARKKGLSGKRSERKQESYMSPLNGLKRSLEELNSIVSVIVNEDKRLTRGMVQKMTKQKATGNSSKESTSRNSVIVINDSDNEAANGEPDSGSASTPSSSVRKKRKSMTPAEQNAGTPSNTPLDNDASVLYLSSTQGSLSNGENIAPAQTEDDVVELWSCLNSKNKKKKIKQFKKRELFRIDRRPNLSYLKYLEADTKDTEKTKCKHRLFQDNIQTEPESFTKPVKRKLSKYDLSSNSIRKKQRIDNLISSSTRSDPHHSEGNRNLDEENQSEANSTRKLREIVVDGYNVAKAHTNGKEFSAKGIKIVVNYFQSRGHVVKVFLPHHARKKEHTFLEQLYREGTVVFTPSRILAGRRITSYDDRYILEYATLCEGVVISTDQYRDLYREKPEWRDTILNRLLIPTFVGDYIMFPEDPLGKFGPNLETFLRH
ncbi:PREDICTED: probable ribonuclease ZC3H12B [Vollenhovia emeryi]|uniref:probable ribonuclease ZC3H12B n=1 Tax=Vollenhovia emeryi TaxID=411798 RepID=UPI0005F54C8C|nr:PREDICTED: probable ribonuclease ZC3H12B [Vollenhovia emeryi]